MHRAVVLALPVFSAGCTVNFYWTDYVVHGELHMRDQSTARGEPAPFKATRNQLVSDPEAARGDAGVAGKGPGISPRSAP